jgi:hypothetical protein
MTTTDEQQLMTPDCPPHILERGTGFRRVRLGAATGSAVSSRYLHTPYGWQRWSEIDRAYLNFFPTGGQEAALDAAFAVMLEREEGN